MSVLSEFWHNVSHNLFKPLLLFFYLGFSIPLFKVSFEFPYVIYQGLTMYLLLAIGWHGGEELAHLPVTSLKEALGFMLLGFCTNFVVGVAAYYLLRSVTRLRRVDAATVAGYYGSDSAGTFVTCVGVLSATGIAYAAYMPVMLAVMEIPGCLVALYLVSRLRAKGMDANGNAWDEAGYDPYALPAEQSAAEHHGEAHGSHHASSHTRTTRRIAQVSGKSYDSAGGGTAVSEMESSEEFESYESGHNANGNGNGNGHKRQAAINREAEMALERIEGEEVTSGTGTPEKNKSIFSKELMHEVFMNPGIFLLFGGILIGFVSALQGEKVTAPDDTLFVNLFQGLLCLFLLEMGITASKRLMDLKKAGWQFILFAVLAPNLFAVLGICVAHAYSYVLGRPFEHGTYVLFAVLCGAASYIAVPAVQRLAIPEASPTLPLAASLGCTFSYNVTIGIPVYILVSKLIMTSLPVASQAVETALR